MHKTTLLLTFTCFTAMAVVTAFLGAGLLLAAPNEPPSAPAPSPVTISYQMPLNGYVAIAIEDKATGKSVRHLIAEEQRNAGPQTEAWNLKDDLGQYAPPGQYIWTGIARPPLKLTYELTVNNSGQPAWFAPAPAKGGGGWMADHTPPSEVCVDGDCVFFGATGAEDGHALIATDLDGTKLWGQANAIETYRGVRRYASDGRYVYALNGAGVLRIDPRNAFATASVPLDITYSRELPGFGGGNGDYIGGAAAKDGKLYIAYNAPSEPWIESSFTPDAVDLDASAPAIRMHRGSRDKYLGYEYDEIMMFHAVFSDGQAPSAIDAVYGPAPSEGPLANTLTVMFKRPVALGSVLVADPAVQVYALKPGAKVTDTEPSADIDPDAGGAGATSDPFDESIWAPLKTVGSSGMPSIAIADKGQTTTALRFKARQLDYALVLNRRYEDLAAQAERVYADGQATDRGGWAVNRPASTPISPFTPATMALVWKEPKEMRGLSFIHLTPGSYTVDYWTGPEGIDPKTAIQDDKDWTQSANFMAEMNDANPIMATVRNIDFGAMVTTRAVRVRAIEPDGWRGGMGRTGIVVTTNHRAGFDAVVVYKHLDGDPPLPADLSQRITEFALPDDPKTGQAMLVRHIPIAQPGHLAFSPTGVLYAVSGSTVVAVSTDGESSPKVVIGPPEVSKPAGIACDGKGLLYVVDQGPNVVKVFDPNSGAPVRTIGTPGGAKLGVWDPQRLVNPIGVGVDRNGKVWVADCDYSPKRIVRFGLDGKAEKNFLGPTTYGGGGWMDPKARSVINYSGMKFTVDWPNYTWKLSSILYRPGLAPSLRTAMPDRVFYHGGNRFLAGDAGIDNCSVICREVNGIAVPVAAAGNLGKWGDVDTHPDLLAAFGKLNRGEYGFVWQDANGDGIPQASEVQITHLNKMQGAGWSSMVGDDMSFNFMGVRLRPVGFKADGDPEYDIGKLDSIPSLMDEWTTEDDRAFVSAEEGDNFTRMLAPDGKELWSYADHFSGVHGSHNTSWDRAPGMLVGELHPVGHFTVGNEELFVDNGNHGDWFAFTRDGLLAACIFGGPGDTGKRYWTMPEAVPGQTDLTGLNLGEEHFYGSICKAEDNNVYAIAGHNHNSVIRVDGLEKMVRVSGTVTVTAEDIEKTVAWNTEQAALGTEKAGRKSAKLVYVDRPMTVNGDLAEWPSSLFLPIHSHSDAVTHKDVTDIEAALTYDHTRLYIMAHSTEGVPTINSATDLTTLYKNGDALDIDLGLDPKADPLRDSASPGDIRILIANVNGHPKAMLYRYVVPGTPDSAHKVFRSPITQTIVDEVKELTGANVIIKEPGGDDPGWVIEASIPWSEIGEAAPAMGVRLRGDVGVLVGDQNGVNTMARYYWSGKSQTIVSDLAFEARIAPALWGDLIASDPDDSMHFGPTDVDPNAAP